MVRFSDHREWDCREGDGLMYKINLTKNGLVAPTVHLNGTSQAELIDQLRTAWVAVDAAIKAVAENGPHQRDYYVQAPTATAWTLARQQHKRRLEKLRDIADELEEIVDNVSSATV